MRVQPWAAWFLGETIRAYSTPMAMCRVQMSSRVTTRGHMSHHKLPPVRFKQKKLPHVNNRTETKSEIDHGLYFRLEATFVQPIFQRKR